MPSNVVIGTDVEMFQSAPDREVGRCIFFPTIPHPWIEFQSAPDREVGRCEGWHGGCPGRGCFNPRPTVRSGDAGAARGAGCGVAVSIRARP